MNIVNNPVELEKDVIDWRFLSLPYCWLQKNSYLCIVVVKPQFS